MRSPSLSAALLALILAACSPPAGDRPVLPPETMTRDPEVPAPVVVPDAVVAMQEQILTNARKGSLSGLARLAGNNPGFISNLDGTPHREYWDLMRRIGIDPNLKLRSLMELPVGVRVVDEETWYVWPDLAARDPANLIPEKLSFQDRKRLKDLVGEDGIARIRAGEAYPGMRLAIAEDGRWVYFVLGLDGED